MAHLSDVEIFDAALRAGFTPDQAVTMTAIALAESGGNTVALNPTGEYSVGLWQINTEVHDWDPAVAEDPLFNARMAYEVSGGGADITRWTVTHEVSGSRYLAFRERAEAAAAAAGHEDARGQWDAPHDYYADGVGAASADSSSRPLFEVGTIPDALDGAADDAAALGATAENLAEPAPGSSFDRDGDGVFDAVEAWLGEDLLPDHSALEELHDPAPGGGHDHGHDHGHGHGEAVDLGTMRNGQLSDAALEHASGGSDSLAAGAPAHSWQAMVAAAAADGVDITYSDAYRPLADQERLARELGLYSQGGRAAAPGTSNHGLGLAVDVNRTPETMAWLEEHSAEYGWINDVPREPWHFNYREALDPDPNRAGPGEGIVADIEPQNVSAFDRDGDGVYDSIETWLQEQGRPLAALDDDPPAAEHDHEDEHEHDHEAVAIEPEPVEPVEPVVGEPVAVEPVVGEPVAVEPVEPEAIDPDALAPVADGAESELSEILDRFNLDDHGDLVLDQLSGADQLELRNALADFVVDRSEIDRESFIGRFDDVVAEHHGVVEFDDVLDLFDFDP